MFLDGTTFQGAVGGKMCRDLDRERRADGSAVRMRASQGAGLTCGMEVPDT